MPSSRKSGSFSPSEALDRLLRESEALRRRSEELAAEVEELRAQLEGKEGRSAERRKKPPLGGK